MTRFFLVCTVLFLLGTTTFTFAQKDPFAAVQAVDAAALSSDELQSFQDYCQSTENIVISRIEPEDLAKVIDGSEKIFILDAREKNEYEISHIPNAKHVGYSEFSSKNVWMIDRNTRVIVYSSASGKRGINLCQYLVLMGFKDVQVLEEGIIGWKNMRFDVVDSDNKKTDKIHIGHKNNMKLARSGLVVY